VTEDDFDTLFSGGTPLKKLVDVLQNANRNVCEHELDKLFERFCAYELYAEKNGFDDSKLTSYIYENQDKLEEMKISAYMSLVADIVTQVE